MKNSIILLSVLLIGSILLVATMMNIWASPPSSAPADSCPYTVQKGDTLIKIAVRLTGRSQNYPAIQQLNDLSSDLIALGQVLYIPKNMLLEEFLCQPETPPAPTPLSKMTLAAEPTATPAPTVIPVPTLTPPPKGKKILAEIEAVVFEDTNGNNEFDEGESGIAGIKLILVKGRVDQPPLTGVTGVTDENGKFLFTNVEPGPRALGLYETTLPPAAALLTESTVLVTVPEGGKSYVNFAVRVEKNQSN